MKTDKKYLIVLLAVLVLYVVYELQKPQPVDWSETFHSRDKIPFGTYVTHDLIPDLFDGQKAKSSYDGFYNMLLEDDDESNQLVIGSQVLFAEGDMDGLMAQLQKGSTVLIGGIVISARIADSLGFEMGFQEQFATADLLQMQNALTGNLKNQISFELPGKAKRQYEFPAVVAASYFASYDKDNWEALAFNQDRFAVLLKSKGLEGDLYLLSMPLVFTNYFVLNEETSEFAAGLLSLFPKDEALTHNEYYQMGRMEPSSKIRFFLQHEALKWSILTLILIMLLFMVFESKRRQRMIPIVTPLKNATIEFVEVLGQLYYRQNDHKKLAKKRLLYWKDFVRSHYNVRTEKLDKDFVDELVRKSGRRKAVVEMIADMANRVFDGKPLDDSEMMAMEQLMNEFYNIK